MPSIAEQVIGSLDWFGRLAMNWISPNRAKHVQKSRARSSAANRPRNAAAISSNSITANAIPAPRSEAAQSVASHPAATVAIALCEAVEEERVRPGALLLMPGFGGGLSYSAHVVRWGSRTRPLESCAV